MQHLPQPAGGSDDSETEGEGGNDGSAACTEVTPGVVTRTRRKRRDSSRQYFGMETVHVTSWILYQVILHKFFLIGKLVFSVVKTA